MTAETTSSAETTRPLSKAEHAYRWIRERIADHTFVAGDKLVLSQIAVDLDTSVVPVREAIRRLEADGLVTFERNVGARVAMVDYRSYVQSMEAVAVLEGAATAQALTHITAADLAEAEALNEDMRALLENFDRSPSPVSTTPSTRRSSPAAPTTGCAPSSPSNGTGWPTCGTRRSPSSPTGRRNPSTSTPGSSHSSGGRLGG